MNTIELELLKRITDQLVGHGLTVIPQTEPHHGEAWHGDAWLRIGKDKQQANYVIEAKRNVTPMTVGAAVAQLREIGQITKRTPMLFTGYVTPPIADRLRAAGQQFADTAGNAYLEGPGLLIYITGKKPEERPAAERPGRAFAIAGLKTMFAFICKPELVQATYREIAEAANVALGALPVVLRDLQRIEFIAVIQEKRRLVATKRLLDEWALAYARKLRPKQLFRTLETRHIENWPEWGLQAHEAHWGGEPAANILTDYLKPGVLTIYADKLPARLVVAQHLLTPHPKTTYGLVEFRKPFWGNAIRPDQKHDTVQPALVYADLLATGDDRCIETAQMIYEKHLARLFQTA
jgi:hypothetical protein